jgi:hypothetical protein
VCVPGDRRCNGNATQACDETGNWSRGTACPFVCRADTGQCGGVCVPGSRRCAGDLAQLCSSSGTWLTLQTCAFVCSGGTCTGVCEPGDQECSGTVLRTCSAAGQWTDSPCPFVCQNDACTGVCVPGQKQCSGRTPQTCDSNGQWVNGTSCPFACSGGACTGECVPGARRCTPDNAVELCDASGKWGALQSCSADGCSGGVCCSAATNTQDCSGKCGTITNRCGVTINCASYGGINCLSKGPGWSCSDNTNQCVCTPNDQEDCIQKCGAIIGRCGNVIQCQC